MARFSFRISAALRRWCKRRERRQASFSMMTLRGDDEVPRGPGWFDSSWDLDRGLEIRWVCPGDPGFSQWIEAMARLPLSGAAAAPDEPWRAQAIEFEIDEVLPDCALAAMQLVPVPLSHSAPVGTGLAPVRPGAVTATLETLDSIAFEAPELELVPI